MCILSTTWFGVAPPLLQPFLGQSCRGILHWESFLENLGRWIMGNPPVWSVGFLVSWYPRWMSTRWVSPPNKNEQHCTNGRGGGTNKKNTYDMLEMDTCPKNNIPKVLSCFWGRPKNPSRKFKHKSKSEVSGRSEKHLTWNPGCFYVVEFTTSLYRDHNQRFLRFLIIYQPCFSFHITIKWTVCRQCSRDSQGFSSSIVPIFGLAVALSRTSMEMNGSWWWKCRCYMQVFGGVVDALTLVVKSTYG